MITLRGEYMTTIPSGSAYAVMPSQSPLTFIDFLLDETGSMGSCSRETCAGFDNFVDSQRDAEGRCFLTLAKFDSGSVKVPYENLDIAMVPKLSYIPN